MEAPLSDRCIFCRIVAGEEPASVFLEDDRFLGLLDVFPWRPGHALLLPRRHVSHLADLGPEDTAALWAHGQRVAAAMRAGAFPCDGVHFLLNDGRAAFQTVPHVHLHVIPRRRGDVAGAMLNLLLRPFPLKRRVPREVLDAQAEALRERLAGEEGSAGS